MESRIRKNWKVWAEYLQFKISREGLYKVKIVEDLIVEKSMLKTKHIFQSPLRIENIAASIKKTIPISKKFYGIIFLVLGVNMSAWRITLGINPKLFE
jgi:hypothetical protein